MGSDPILLLGGSGYVGTAFIRFFEESGLDYVYLPRTTCDYTVKGELAKHLREHSYRFLINAAGFTGKPNVDACELQKTDTLAGNAILPGLIREACEAVGLTWGHVSSGCIYSGARPTGTGFREEDQPNFSFRSGYCSFYSGSKALGEEVLEGAENCYVWRLRIPFNEVDSGRNYLSKLMRYERLLEAENSISQLDEFVATCWQSLEKECEPGVYNLTNPGFVTTTEVVEMILKSGVCKKDFKFFESEAEFMQIAAKTPRSNCILETVKAERAGLQMSPVRAAVEKALANWIPEKS